MFEGPPPQGFSEARRGKKVKGWTGSWTAAGAPRRGRRQSS